MTGKEFIQKIARSYEIADEIAQLGHKMDLADQRDSNYEAQNPEAFWYALLIIASVLLCFPVAIWLMFKLPKRVEDKYPDIKRGRERIPVLFKEWDELRDEIKKAWKIIENTDIASKFQDDIDNLDFAYDLLWHRYTDAGRLKTWYSKSATMVVNGIIKYAIPTALILCGIAGGLSNMVNSAGSQIGSGSSTWLVREMDDLGNILREYRE